jgi:energy-coupling factor transporter ATP-binding protein EcfA2
MKKYFILSVDSLVTTFSKIESGKELEFTIKTEDTNLNEQQIGIDDIILVSLIDKVYYQFNVTAIFEDVVKLHKTFEIEKSIGKIIENNGYFTSLSKDEYLTICSKLFNSYENNIKVDTKPIGEDLIKSKKIREFVFEVFKMLVKEFGTEFLQYKHAIAERKHGDIKYKAYLLPDYFNSKNILGSFEEEQNEESLKTSSTPRFFSENLIILDQKYIYFSTQWGFPNLQYSSDFISFNNFVTDYSHKKYQIDYDEISGYYKLVSDLNVVVIEQINFNLKKFQSDINPIGLFLNNQLITRFATSLLTKPFVILTGLSGSGKTKLAQAFATWISENETQYKIVPVGADWTNREPLLGFPNGLDSTQYVTPDSGSLELIIRATKEENQDKPYFLILDEMNLSHVERYFADFLSVMESKEKVMLYSGAARTSSNGSEIPTEIAWPKNLFIVGTVNIDETTYMFSPKVLDRANVIEFRVTESEMESYLSSAKQLDMDSLKAGGATMAADFVSKAKADTVQAADEEEINNALLAFFRELKKSGAEFGYRSASEILRFAGVANGLDSGWKVDDVIDAAVMQKLLPKVHGSRNKLCKILPVLGGFCLVKPEKVKEDYLEKFDSVDFENDANIKYKLSFEKICRMYRNAIENGYASYAEA